MHNLIDTNYINHDDKNLVDNFVNNKNVKKYILGINKLAKSVKKFVEVDGIIDDFTRVQSSRKKSIFKIEDIPKDCIILWVSTGSPLEVKAKLDSLGYKHFSYLSFCKYTTFDLTPPPFMMDFESDYFNNNEKYKYTYDLLCDEQSKSIFEKVINFKISFDYSFMHGFTNNFEEQYFDKDIIPKIKDITFIDAGAYVGDTLPAIIQNFPDFKKIYCIEPNDLHLNIAKRNFEKYNNIEFIHCGLGKEKLSIKNNDKLQNNCEHDFQASTVNTIDNLINEKVDFIKMDIEGAEQDAIVGAKNTIKNYTPILAICIYHKAEDWYKVPEQVLKINPNYKIYLRHYMEGIFETVMYFIPSHLK